MSMPRGAARWVASSFTVLQQSGVEDEQPPAADLRVTLAGSTLPVKRLAVRTSAPQGIHVDNGEAAIALLGYDDTNGASGVVH
jgi:hypothetical protein